MNDIDRVTTMDNIWARKWATNARKHTSNSGRVTHSALPHWEQPAPDALPSPPGSSKAETWHRVDFRTASSWAALSYAATKLGCRWQDWFRKHVCIKYRCTKLQFSRWINHGEQRCKTLIANRPGLRCNWRTVVQNTIFLEEAEKAYGPRIERGRLISCSIQYQCWSFAGI